jgi:hypothetical protein
MRNEQPMQDQPKDPGQQKRWYAYIDSEMVGGKRRNPCTCCSLPG